MRKMTTTGSKVKKNRPEIKLGIPDLEHSKAAVLRSLGSPDSRRGYQHAIDEFVAWYCSEPRLAFNKTVVLRYRFYLEERGLAPGNLVQEKEPTSRQRAAFGLLLQRMTGVSFKLQFRYFNCTIPRQTGKKWEDFLNLTDAL